MIDDRSTDRTGPIASELADRDPRIRVLSNDHLPPGWTGKTHVLHQAAEQARGDWLWFLDADTVHAPEFLGVMMEYARAQRAALVSLLPELRCETFWEQLVQPLGAIVLMQSFPLHRVNDDRSKLAFANGQSILDRAAAYDAAGGHAAVRDRFVEDIGMAVQGQGAGAADPHGPGAESRDLPDVCLARTAHPGLEPDPLRRPRPQDLAPCRPAARPADLLPERARRAPGRGDHAAGRVLRSVSPLAPGA